MREKKFTPGPWKLTGDIPPNVYGEYLVDIKEGAQPMVAMTDVNECPSCGNIFYGPEQMTEIEANAALISAAPELLAALERLLMFTKGECLKYPEGISKIEQAEAAIAKAYGE